MAGWLSSLFDRLGSRKEREQDRALYWLKARYHIFRVVLSDNERALSLLAEVDRLTREAEPEALAEAAHGLADTVLDLVDGLNRLDDSAHLGLYARLADIREHMDAALDQTAAASPLRFPTLEELGPEARAAAGGKAVALGLLRRAGLPVPNGFAIPVAACLEHLRRTRIAERLRPLLRAAGGEDGESGGLEAAAAEIQRMILAADLAPEFKERLAAARARLTAGRPLAVRSSAVAEDGKEHSFAGQYRSVLQVVSPEGLEQAFREVLASAFSARVLAYRRRAGLSLDSLDLAVLCLEMVEPRAAGVLFTRDPTRSPGDGDDGRMLVSAVPGLGTAAVSGSAAADIYRPHRDPAAEPIDATPAQIADKAEREAPDPAGGLRVEPVPAAERSVPLLTPAELAELRAQALRIEALADGPQDIEWAVDRAGALWILQARPARVATAGSQRMEECGRELLTGGVGASPGRAAGRAAVAHTREDLDALARAPGDEPLVLVLAQSLPDAARLLPIAAGVAVDLGNPLDHLSCVAREQGVPMVTGLGTASTSLRSGDWILVDGDRGRVLSAQECVWRDFVPARRAAPPPAPGGKGRAALRELVLPLNLTDAYGPTFSAAECRSLHDLVRFVHEKAVLAMFEAGDAVTEDAFSLVRRLDGVPGMPFFVLDVGGGLAPGAAAVLDPADILSEPLAALFAGMMTPGLRWGVAPPVGNIAGLMTRAMLDGRSERPVGEPNYALVSRDYLNLNAKVDYHFTMVDAVCGPNSRENAVRFRFKGGGTVRVQRERRALLVEEVLVAERFFTTREGDMVTAQFSEGPREVVREKLLMLGRFLGFSRLLDAAMVDDAMPGRAARAFLAGDYMLDSLERGKGGEGQP
jgi:pyruvate,water dikinase